MAKGVRSKRIRANKTEFRTSIGSQAADAAMALTQAKLLECIAKGNGATLSRTAALLGGDGEVEDCDGMSDGEEEDGEKAIVVGEKVGGKTKKHANANAAGQHGAHRARIAVSKSNKRGQTKNGFKITKKGKAPAVKRNKKMAKF